MIVLLKMRLPKTCLQNRRKSFLRFYDENKKRELLSALFVCDGRTPNHLAEKPVYHPDWQVRGIP